MTMKTFHPVDPAELRRAAYHLERAAGIAAMCGGADLVADFVRLAGELRDRIPASPKTENPKA
ncbi:hypothetical protein [Paracoccus siganidrum]|uniref:Uncharacterized protein n=1 Tax=Paracoccus siganidrum TaxID=1276757 RepID=A0A419A4I8_9RHOB|nr:hypothetical protein [Paracoccus siganidrum]RJL09429.1 hypothetical protein D3P05_14890 [Paracoccus siganidrum]RMC39003.1 hypothetical protein C9E82_06635 [Paracoccus siganidrum]